MRKWVLESAWVNFVGTELENINMTQNKELGGYNPKKGAQMEEEDNYKIEIDIKKIYEVFNCFPANTSPFKKFSQYFQNGPLQQKKDDLEYREEE